MVTAFARLDPVNNPELLPKDYTNVIDVAGFLTPGQEDRIAARIDSLEKATGFKLRVLAQNYPNTPGLAIKYVIEFFSQYVLASEHISIIHRAP